MVKLVPIHQRSTIVIAFILAVVVAVVSPIAWQRWNEHRRDQLSKECRRARSGKQWDQLQSIAAGWTAWDPHNGDAWMNRGLAENGRGHYADAAQSFRNVPDSSSQAIPAMIELSKLAFTHLNDPLSGVEACERILKIDPLANGARQQLIWFYAMTLQREKLRQQIVEAIRLHSEPREAYIYYFLLYTLKSQDAVDLNNRWLQGTPDSELFAVAHVLNLPDPQPGSPETPMTGSTAPEQSPSASKKTKLEQVAELLQRFPHNLELIAYKAEERFTNGDIAAAAALLANAPESAAHDSRFWRFKGWIHESNNELDAAAAAYRQALQRHPVDWNTMNRLAIVERRLQHQADVERLTDLVERANETRKKLRQQHAVETASPQILQEIATLYRDCNAPDIAQALEARLSSMRSPNPTGARR